MSTIYVITGQTATGKTKSALELAAKHNGEIINCDSRQIYRHLDIITGKDFEEKNYTEHRRINDFSIGYYKLLNINLWLYDIVDPKEYFSAFDYRICALDVIKDILARNKIPIIVGGTYFYLKQLLYDIATEEVEPNWGLRNDLEKKSVSELQEDLNKTNPHLFKQLNNSDKNNPRRLIRKIELSQQDKGMQMHTSKYTYDNLQKDLKISNLDVQITGRRYEDKDKLIARIKNRVEKRITNGAIEEVESLVKNGYTKDDPGLQTIGYKQILNYLDNNIDKDIAIQQWITKEVQYAKRQYTFMKKDPHIVWKVST